MIYFCIAGLMIMCCIWAVVLCSIAWHGEEHEKPIDPSSEDE